MTDPKQTAENLFLNTDKSQKEIAEETGIDPKALYRWIKQGHWRELKSATRRMPSVLVENIYAQLDDINYCISQRDRGQRHPGKDESLTINRLVNCIEKVKKQTSQGQNIEFLMNFVNWIMPQNKDLADTLTEYGSAFLKSNTVQGFHPYDIEYENGQCPDSEEDPESIPRHCEECIASCDATTKQSEDENMPESSGKVQPQNPEIGHESGIEKIEEKTIQPTENQPKTPENPQIKMPEMPENNSNQNRACEQTSFPSLRSMKQPRQNTGSPTQEDQSISEPNIEPQPFPLDPDTGIPLDFSNPNILYEIAMAKKEQQEEEYQLYTIGEAVFRMRVDKKRKRRKT